MEMTQYQKDFVRMLDSMREEHKGETTCVGIENKECEECLLATICGDNDICFNAEKIVEIVTQWAKEHPIVTNEQKYKEVFGVEPKNKRGEYVCPAWAGFDICYKDAICSKGCNENFWTSEYKEPKKEVSE